MTETFQVTMEKMVYGGDCIGRLPDGRAVFVPFVLPGEQVEIEIVEEKKRFAKGRPVRIIEASPDRITPRCIHFGICGGCQYQEIDYAKQLETKQAIMLDQLQRIAGLDDPPLRPIVPSPSPWNYRNYCPVPPRPVRRTGLYRGGWQTPAADQRVSPPPGRDQRHLAADRAGGRIGRFPPGNPPGLVQRCHADHGGRGREAAGIRRGYPHLRGLHAAECPSDGFGGRGSPRLHPSGTEFHGLSPILLPSEHTYGRKNGPAFAG